MLNTSTPTVEICAASYQSALAAQLGGAHRIELCAALEIGGITPSYATIELVKQTLDIPVFVLIRPRGGDFCYTSQELQVMLKDIAICKTIGVDGIVSGALTTDGNIDLPSTKTLIQASENLPFTFHRAFDCCQNPFLAATQLEDLGVSRILSAGQQVSAIKGAKMLAKLIENFENKIIFLAGGGITPDNVSDLLQQTKATEIHLSAKKTRISNAYRHTSNIYEPDYDETDIKTVKMVMDKITQFQNKI